MLEVVKEVEGVREVPLVEEEEEDNNNREEMM
jgi:hypothetical protein